MAERHQLYHHHWRLLNGYVSKGFLRLSLSLGRLPREFLSVSFVDGKETRSSEFSEWIGKISAVRSELFSSLSHPVSSSSFEEFVDYLRMVFANSKIFFSLTSRQYIAESNRI